MDLKEQQFRLMDTLLRSVSRNAQDPEAFKLLFGVFWKDMASAAGGRTGRDWEPKIYFSCVLCRDDEVLAAAMPRLLLKEDEEMPLQQRHLDALRAVGLPLFYDFFTKEKGTDGEVTLDLKSRDCPGPSGWRFPTIRVPSELSGLLCKKGMVFGDRSPEPVPTRYGNQLGLCKTRWYGGEPAGDPCAATGLYCSAAGWVDRVRLGEHPWGDGPDWAPLPLDTRLARMRAGQAGSPGHCMSALLRLEAMPMESILPERLGKAYIEKYRPELQELYAPGITYGQAARNADRLLRSELEEERTRGRSSLTDLIGLFVYENHLRRSPDASPKPGESGTINETKAADRSLSARLNSAGIRENSSPYLPLTGDRLTDVFQGLSRLIGSDAPAQAFQRETPPWLWEKLGGEWDGSLDGMIYRLWSLYSAAEAEPAFKPEMMRVFRRLLIEPFCLLEEIRSLEEKHSVQLEELRKQNEALKKELERMNFDGSAH